MKKSILKVTAAAVLVSQFLTLGAGFQENTASAAAPVSTAKPVPVMTDNLFKYGLKKDVELPVTVTAGGLSYTLEKIMIYDYNSKDALALRKLYDYSESAGPIDQPKYFVWTKITIKNNSQKLVQKNYKDLASKWRLFFDKSMNMGEAYEPMPYALKKEDNSTKALHNFSLSPGKSLTTYKAYYYVGEFKYFEIFMRFNGETKSRFIVNDPEAK